MGLTQNLMIESIRPFVENPMGLGPECMGGTYPFHTKLNQGLRMPVESSRIALEAKLDVIYMKSRANS